MPPKKDAGDKKAPAKPEKPGGAQGTAGEENPPSPFDILAASPAIKNVFLLLAVLLLFFAVVGSVFYYFNWERTDGLFKAVIDIRKDMTSKGEVTATMSDAEVLNEAKRVADDLFNWNKDNTELQSTIRDIKEKRKDGWIAFKGHLYYLSIEKGDLIEARYDCEKNNSMFAYIQSEEEERFLEELVRRKQAPHSFGLIWVRGYWTWDTGYELETKDTYWSPGKPEYIARDVSDDKRKSCAFMITACSANLKCWDHDYCHYKKNWICKMQPDPKIVS